MSETHFTPTIFDVRILQMLCVSQSITTSNNRRKRGLRKTLTLRPTGWR